MPKVKPKRMLVGSCIDDDVYEVLIKDKLCYYCHRITDNEVRHNGVLQGNDSTIEHIQPRHLGGSNAHTNTANCCYGCNQYHEFILRSLIMLNEALWDCNTFKIIISGDRLLNKILLLNKRMKTVNYNPCPFYASFMSNCHPNLLKHVGEIKLRNQSYINAYPRLVDMSPNINIKEESFITVFSSQKTK